MKRMKKILAFVLAMAMVLGMSVTAFAEADSHAGADGKIGTSDDKGKITIQNVEQDAQIIVYKIVGAQYDNATGSFVEYKSVGAAFDEILKAEGADKVDYDTLATRMDQAMINAIGDKAAEENLAPASVTWGSWSKTADADAATGTPALGTKSTGIELEVGMYLIKITGTETTTSLRKR